MSDSNMKKWLIVAGVVASALVVVVIALALGLGLGLKDRRPATSGRLLSDPDHLLRRIDCYPEARWGRGAVGRVECERRGCEFDPDAPPGVPKCFVSADSVLGAGYAATSVDRRPDGFTAELRTRARADADVTIRPLNAVLDVEYAGENVLRLKVHYTPLHRRCI